ncbi:hypothetical protein CEUSTIGMA_g11501.t1 [Chlamydomonas eustigma]|uniref:tRNA/rRNA methyltransferase SpoU type domain-containing protein n=1 Tax=Chlamydomonas eustigma TaxID=1157962 RepID=A0A250XLY5_9CHLO|nr:hypothetical protein CEUSTIGMA_g11501.t1 [Chlamydomonas eustigma]|eukprot:GAX84077.1 hypothetical protein CEUSTIGMA_g11501.t1 [Chlamydomonas eustigma]
MRFYSEEEYLLQKQSSERSMWASSVRAATGNRKHQFWEPQLSPPALLHHVIVILMSPRRAVSLGTVSRSASCFEVSQIRVVQPRCDYVTRHSKSASKGAQYLLLRAETYNDLGDAIKDCDLSVAFTRWIPSGRSIPSYDLPALMRHPTMQTLIKQPVDNCKGASEECSVAEAPQVFSTAPGANSESDHKSQQGVDESPCKVRDVKVALVFGREELGMSDEEVETCDIACSIPIGRLQESLSLSHAVSIALSGIYAQRLEFVSQGGADDGLGYKATSAANLADGYDASMGIEV